MYMYVYTYVSSFHIEIWAYIICDMVHSCVWHDSSIWVTWLIHMCGITHSWMWRDSFICVRWLIYKRDWTHPCTWLWLIHVFDMTNPYLRLLRYRCFATSQSSLWLVWGRSKCSPSLLIQSALCMVYFWYVTWLILTREVTHCDTTHPYIMSRD